MKTYSCISFKELHFEMSSGKWHLNMLNTMHAFVNAVLFSTPERLVCATALPSAGPPRLCLPQLAASADRGMAFCLPNYMPCRNLAVESPNFYLHWWMAALPWNDAPGKLYIHALLNREMRTAWEANVRTVIYLPTIPIWESISGCGLMHDPRGVANYE